MAIESTHIYTKKRPDFSMVEILVLKSVRNLVVSLETLNEV